MLSADAFVLSRSNIGLPPLLRMSSQSYVTTRPSYHFSSSRRVPPYSVHYSMPYDDSFMSEADELFEFMDTHVGDDDDDDDNYVFDNFELDGIIISNITIPDHNEYSSTETYPSMNTPPLAPASEIAYFYLKNTVGLSETTMWKIIQKSGSILGLTVPTLQNKISLLTRTMNLSDEDIRTIIHRQPSILTMSANRNISPTILFLVKALDLGKDDLRTIIVQYPCILCYSIDNLQDKLEFFSAEMKLEMDQMRTLLVNEPRLLCAGVKTGLRPRMKFLMKEISIPLEDLRSIVRRNPKILLYSIHENLATKLISFFIMRLRMEPKHVLRILKAYPAIIDYNLENHMLPIAVYFLSDLEFSPIEFRSILLKFPRLMTHSTFKIKHVVGYLRYQLGMDAVQVKRVLFQAPQVVSLDTENNLAFKVKFLKDELNLDKGDDLRKLISGMPTLILCSVDNNLRPKIEYLRDAFGGDEAKLRRVALTLPTLLGYSLEKRIRPRMKRLVAIGSDPKKITIGITMKEEKFDEWLLNTRYKLENQGNRRLHKSTPERESSPAGQLKLTEEQRKGRIVHWKR